MAKTFFITGPSSGFGWLLTERLLARGDRVVATVRKTGPLDDLQERYGDRLNEQLLDVTDTDAVWRVVDRAFQTMGRIDVVISNAGYGLLGTAEEVTDQQIDKLIATNLVGSIQVVRAALPHLREQGGGRIVQLASMGGQVSATMFSIYHATKWGVEGFIEAVSQEAVSFGIDFLIVEPAPTNTSIWAKSSQTEPMEAYQATVSGEVRRVMADGSFPVGNDIGKTVDAMIAAIDEHEPALQLTLGSEAYDSISKALSERSAALLDQRQVAMSADAERNVDDAPDHSQTIGSTTHVSKG